MELLEVNVEWVVFHTLVLVVILQELIEELVEPDKRISWSTLLVFLLEICVFLRVCSVVWLNALLVRFRGVY